MSHRSDAAYHGMTPEQIVSVVNNLFDKYDLAVSENRHEDAKQWFELATSTAHERLRPVPSVRFNPDTHRYYVL